MRTYKLILELNISHEFYPENKIPSSDLKIIPTQQTITNLRNYRMVLKNYGNQIKIYYEYDKTEKKENPAIEINKELEFVFLIVQNNPQFINFTEIPFIAMNREIMYFTNKKNNKIIENGSLSKDNFVSDKDIAYFLPKKIDIITNQKDIDFNIYNSAQEIVKEHKKGKSAIDTAVQFINENKNGKYILNIKNQENVFVLYNSKTESGIIGYIDFSINENIIKFTEKNEKPYSYSINFKTRSLFWEYYIIQKYNSLDNIQIIDEANEMIFELQEELMNNDKAAKIFVSKQKNKILKENTKNLKLITKNGNKSFEKTLYEKLPFPDIKNIGKHKIKKYEFTCKSYVYV